MRVLAVGNMYPPHHLGGYELMWRSAVERLREWGHDVRVLTTDHRASELDREQPTGGGGEHGVARELRWYWRDHRFPRLGPRATAKLERHNRAVLARHLADFEPDALSWWAMGGMSLSLIEQGRRAGLPAAFAVVDDWLHYGPLVDSWSRLARRVGPGRPLLERAAGVPATVDLDHAGVWLFASEALRDGARSAGLAPTAQRVAYPGIDQHLFAPAREPREEWRGRFFYCGRIDERKGIDIAIEALALVPEPATLTIVGDGDDDHRAWLRELVDERGLGSRVRFERRARAELPAAYAAADATLFPVRWQEPFGLVPLESMAMGTPVVASGRGGSGEYLRDGENCVLFEVDGGPRSLADAIGRLAGDRALRTRLHRGGLKSARAFPSESFDRAVEASLVEALGRSSG